MVETKNNIIERFATIQKISYEEAEELIGAPTDEEILDKLAQFTIAKIQSQQPKLNRAQRRAMRKKGIVDEFGEVNEVAKKLNYISLIQKFRELNERKAKEIEENGEATTEDDRQLES